MKPRFNLWMMCVVVVVSMLWPERVWAGRIVGTLVSLGTVQPQTGATRKTIRFGMVLRSTCDAEVEPIERVITITRITLDADPHPLAAAHLAANFSNGYSTLLAALLAGNRVELAGADADINCDIRQFDFDRITIGIVAEPVPE